jgi:BNR repeat-containing family member
VRGFSRLWRFVCGLALIGALVVLAVEPEETTATRPSAPGSFGNGSWCWFADPRAVHVVGRYDRTFVGWIDWGGAIRIGGYDAGSGPLGSYVVGRIIPDDHSAPAILVEPDQQLTVFWSGHNGSEMYYRTTRRPEDIRSWGPVHHIHSLIGGGLGFTYPNPELLPAEHERLYLFWRGADWSADFATRTAGGSWSRARELIRNPGARPYLKVAGNGRDTIALAYTNGHPRNLLTSVYYAAVRGGSLWTAGGRRIARLGRGPIRPSQGQLVYDARRTRVAAWVWDVAFTRHGHPVILYATFPSAQRHLYWYAVWTGRRWASHFITVGGPSISPGTIEYEYSGGMTLDPADPSVVYLSRQVRGWFEIERWTTGDGGAHWRHRTVVRTAGADDVRPLVPWGAPGGPLGLLWLHGHYGSYTAYRTVVDYLR